MYDVIVVGARCAGAPTAMLLARQGHRVLLVDRAAFPSDTVSTHWLGLEGTRTLRRWGLLEAVLATGCPPVRGRTLTLEDFTLGGTAPNWGDLPGAVGPRRTVLDTMLVRAAIAVGAEFRPHVTFEEVLWDDGRVRGMRAHVKGGGRFEEAARLVVGADGKHSAVARAVGAATLREEPVLTFGYYSYFADFPMDGIEGGTFPERGRFIVAFPTNDGLSVVFLQAAIADFPAFRADIPAGYWRTMALIPEFAARLREARRVEPFRGSADLPNFLRQAWGPGWALVGDAGFCRDPLPARGIRDAFDAAERLATAADAGLSGRLPLDEALARFQRERDTAVLPALESTCRRARFPHFPPALFQLRAALRGDQELTDYYIGVGFGTVRPEEFLARAPEPIGALFAASREQGALGGYRRMQAIGG